MFSNRAKIELMTSSPRDVILIEDMIFYDKNGIEWFVPAGAIVNGTSIPKILWPIMGSPWVGYARRASIPHDYYYQSREHEKDLVDDMFYEAAIYDGVPHIKAHAMLLGLQITGSTWAEYDARNEEEDDD